MKRRLLFAAPLIVATVAALSGCTLANAINPPITAAIYATTDEAKGADSSVALPDFVQGDATMIRIKANTSDNAKILSYTVPQPALPEGSDPATPPPAVAPIGEACPSASTPSLDDTWWIESIATDAPVTCSGSWHILVSGTQIYAWTP